MKSVGTAILIAAYRNPSAIAGLCVFALAFAMVANNAMLGQKGGHPVPLFSTRDSMITRSLPPARSVPPLARETQIPLPEMRPKAETPSSVQETASGDDDRQLLREIQSGLAKRGLYTGSVDGLIGPMTREAIRRFEQQAGLTVTGQPSSDLLARVRQSPAPKNVVVQRATPETETRTAHAEPTVQRVAFQNEESGDGRTLDLQEIRDAALVARVQIGLRNFGEEIVPDGVIGDRTVAAIRRFQTRFGLTVTGLPDDTLVRKMEQIGILKQG